MGSQELSKFFLYISMKWLKKMDALVFHLSLFLSLLQKVLQKKISMRWTLKNNSQNFSCAVILYNCGIFFTNTFRFLWTSKKKQALHYLLEQKKKQNCPKFSKHRRSVFSLKNNNCILNTWWKALYYTCFFFVNHFLRKSYFLSLSKYTLAKKKKMSCSY